MKRISLFVVVVALLGLAAAFTVSSCDEIVFPPQQVSMREKIAQMLIVGFRGTTPQELEALQEAGEMGATYYVEQLGVGGVLLLNVDVPGGRVEPRNIEGATQLKILTSYLRGLSKTPLLVSIDQEGGYVSRLQEKYGFPPTLSAYFLGQHHPEMTTMYSEQTAQLLRELHINTNFAPCVDVNVNPNSPAIGAFERSFSADTLMVVQHATAWIKGHRNYGVLSVLKHFPGHGSAADDSHLGVVDVTNTWKPYELAPYRDLIATMNPDMVMTAHVFQRDLDSEYPATLSKAIIDGILRKELNFKGVVVSDDLCMKAITDHFSWEKVFELAINAGNDMLILSNNNVQPYDPYLPLKAVNIIEHLVETGRISPARIDQAYYRIMQLKRRMQ